MFVKIAAIMLLANQTIVQFLEQIQSATAKQQISAKNSPLAFLRQNLPLLLLLQILSEFLAKTFQRKKTLS